LFKNRKIRLYFIYIYYKKEIKMPKIKKTKKKVAITVDSDIYEFLGNFENKSKCVEYLIYKDIKECGLLKKEIIL